MTAKNISLEDIPTVVTEVVTELTARKSAGAAGAMVLTLSGNLGAGKTTFVQALAAHVGVSEPVQSPTFVILKQYDTTSDIFTTLVHVDAYRIEDVAELAPLHFADVLNDPYTLVCIEWPEHIASALPPSAYGLTFEVVDDTTRRVTGLPTATA